MKKYVWKTEGGDLFFDIDFDANFACMRNPRKMFYGKSITDLKEKIYNVLNKLYGFVADDIRYQSEVISYPAKMEDMTREAYTARASTARYIKKRCAYLMRQPSGRFHGIHHSQSTRFTGDGINILIDLINGKIFSLGMHVGAILPPELGTEIAKQYHDGMFGYLTYMPVNAKLIGITKDGTEEVCQIKIDSGLKHFKLMQGLKILPLGYFKYFQSNYQTVRWIEDRTCCEKFLAQSQLLLDIS